MSDTQKKIIYRALYYIIDMCTDSGLVFLFLLLYMTFCAFIMLFSVPIFVFMLNLLIYTFSVYISIRLVCYICRQVFLWKLANKLSYDDFEMYKKYCSKAKDYFYCFSSNDVHNKPIRIPMYEKVTKITGRPVWCIKGKFR